VAVEEALGVCLVVVLAALALPLRSVPAAAVVVDILAAVVEIMHLVVSFSLPVVVVAHHLLRLVLLPQVRPAVAVLLQVTTPTAIMSVAWVSVLRVLPPVLVALVEVDA
jgi:hypothetical protein